MFSHLFIKRSNKSESESPFWISFADLMTALMTLFLVVMAVMLISIKVEVTDVTVKEAARQDAIRIVMGLLKSESTPFARVKVDEANFRLDLGDIVYFESGSSAIKPEVAAELRAYLPTLLKVKNSNEGKVIKQFVIEGFTDQDGSYTLNLALSTDRSRNVICSLVSPIPITPRLSDAQLVDIQRFFSVGGFSSYAIREDKRSSRRVEIRVEFWTVDELTKGEREPLLNPSFGIC
jgi:outer membrane protein OmpA-like peptidoglycan-associated protein